VLQASHCDELACAGKARNALLGDDHRSHRIRGSADREIGKRDAVQPVLVTSKCGQKRLPEVGLEANCRLQSRIKSHLLPRLAHRRGQSRASHQHHGFAAEARPEAADPSGVDVIAPLRMRKQEV
jgi:hypothetical protein